MSNTIKTPSTHIVKFDLSKDGEAQHIANVCDNYHNAGMNLSSMIQHQQYVLAIFQEHIKLSEDN